MSNITTKLQAKYPKLNFTPSDSFYWSPETREIYYIEEDEGQISDWSIMHEVGHALLNHVHYDSDFMLLKLEIEAWQKAQELATLFGMEIEESHIQDCLDTYRDWLYKRSICPKCSNNSLQQSDFSHYRCFNCHMRWRVTTSRFCRTYRMADNTIHSQQVFV